MDLQDIDMAGRGSEHSLGDHHGNQPNNCGIIISFYYLLVHFMPLYLITYTVELVYSHAYNEEKQTSCPSSYISYKIAMFVRNLPIAGKKFPVVKNSIIHHQQLVLSKLHCSWLYLLFYTDYNNLLDKDTFVNVC